jgi:hypothetical protein
MWEKYRLSKYINPAYNKQNQADWNPQDRFSRLSLASLLFLFAL